jgi:hypothetical protein
MQANQKDAATAPIPALAAGAKEPFLAFLTSDL